MARDPHIAATYARSAVGHGTYLLGTGDHDSPLDGAFDCWGFGYCWTYGEKRHRAEGFNRGWRDLDGRTPSVSDDLNCNSAIEDADHNQALFVRADRPMVGDLLAYPTIHLAGHPPFIGHVAIIVGVSRMLEFDTSDAGDPDWSLLDVVQCAGPNGRHPGIFASNAAHWTAHDKLWPKPEHRSVVLRCLA